MTDTLRTHIPPPNPVPGFQWREEYALGHPEIDAMHHEFSVLLDRLLLSSHADLADSLDAFLDHARRHFDEEARQMRETRYSGASCHLEEHAAVLASGEEVRGLLAAGRHDVVRRFAAELARWFPKHSDEMDRSLSHWLLTRRSDGRHPVKLVRRANP